MLIGRINLGKVLEKLNSISLHGLHPITLSAYQPSQKYYN